MKQRCRECSDVFDASQEDVYILTPDPSQPDQVQMAPFCKSCQKAARQAC